MLRKIARKDILYRVLEVVADIFYVQRSAEGLVNRKKRDCLFFANTVVYVVEEAMESKIEYCLNILNWPARFLKFLVEKNEIA